MERLLNGKNHFKSEKKILLYFKQYKIFFFNFMIQQKKFRIFFFQIFSNHCQIPNMEYKSLNEKVVYGSSSL